MRDRSIGATGLVCGALVATLLLATPGAAWGQTNRTTPVLEAAEQALAARYPESVGHLEVRVRRFRGSLDQNDEIRLDFPGHHRRPGGPTQVKVQTKTASGRWTENGWALLQVARYDSVLSVRDPIQKGEEVSPARVETAWIEVSELNGQPLRASEYEQRRAEGSLIATRYLQAGDVVRKGEVRRPYTTDTGTAIDLKYTSDRFMLRLSCKAREPGFKEEVIRVYCPDTESTYRARVTGEDTAKWIETL